MGDAWIVINWWELSLVPVVIIGILMLMTTVKITAAHFEIGAETQRKIVHVAVGTSSLFFPYVFSGPLPVVLLTGCAMVIMFSLRYRKKRAAISDGVSGGLSDVLYSVQRSSFGEIYLALAVVFLFFLSTGQPILYVLPLLVITLSDTASALIGTSYGRLRFPVEDGIKSFEGVVAFFTVTWICAMIVLLLMSDTARLNVIVLSFLIAAFCALVEADSWRGLDNIFVPVGAYLLLSRHMETQPSTLLLVALAFVATMVIAIRYSGVWGISNHAARSYTILLFLILSATIPINVTLPVVVILTHVLASKYNPCRSPTADLDLLASATGCSLLWLFAGDVIQITVINLFNLTFAGAAVAFASLAVRGEAVAPRWRIAVVPAAMIIAATCVAVARMNPAITQWYQPYWPYILASTGLSLVIPFFLPDWFRKWRGPRVFGVAMIVPFVLFIIDGVMA